MKRKFRGDNRLGLLFVRSDGTRHFVTAKISYRALTRWKKKRIRRIERTRRRLKKMSRVMCDLKIEDEMHLYRAPRPLILLPAKDVKV